MLLRATRRALRHREGNVNEKLLKRIEARQVDLSNACGLEQRPHSAAMGAEQELAR
jgi:hypothetical protein